jgi:hypothetical protein
MRAGGACEEWVGCPTVSHRLLTADALPTPAWLLAHSYELMAFGFVNLRLLTAAIPAGENNFVIGASG